MRDIKTPLEILEKLIDEGWSLSGVIARYDKVLDKTVMIDTEYCIHRWSHPDDRDVRYYGHTLMEAIAKAEKGINER